MKKYLDKGLSQLGKANAFFSQRGEEAESPVDISSLSPEDALAQLQGQNKAVIAKNRQLKASSDKHFEENGLLKQQLVDLRSYVKEVEQDRATYQDRYHRTQMQHKQTLEQLQQECDAMAKQMKDSQGENHVLQGEVTDLRFKLMMAGSEASGVPENTIQEWQTQKERMQSQLQAAQEKYFEILKREKAAEQSASGVTGTALDMAKLRAVEKELVDSKSQVSQLTERCEELQKQVEAIKSETPGPTAQIDQLDGTEQQSAFFENAPAPEGGEGWGDADESWGAWDKEEKPSEQQQLAAVSEKQPSRTDGVKGRSASGVQAEATVITSALRALLEQGKESGAEAVVVKDVITLLSEYRVATDSMGNNSSNTKCVDTVRNAATDSPALGCSADATDDSVVLGVVQPGAERPDPSEDDAGFTLGSTASKQLSIALPPVNIHVPSICSEPKGPSADSHLSPGTAELFDAVGVAAGNSGTPPHLSAEAATAKLQLPLIAWESFSAAELSRYLQILSAVSCAVSGDRKASSLSLQAHSKTGESIAEAASTAALHARVRAAEEVLVSSCSELAQAQLHMTRSSQRSTLRTMSGPNSGLPMMRRLSGDTAAAPDTPVSDTGSPGLPSMTTLNRILQDLLSEHQALLKCAEGSKGNASEHRATSQKLAAAAEAELHRLQALLSQQQDEVSIQWSEKQQLQSVSQNEIATARQELAVRQQENEMLREKIEELESAHGQVTCERDNLHQQTQDLHQQVQTHSQIMSSPAALQDLVTVQMMPRLDLGSDSTLTPTSNHQSTPTPHDISAQGLIAENSGGTAALAAKQRAEVLQGQLADVTAERDDLLAGIDQIEECATARIQQDEQVVERLMIAEGQLEERTNELQVVRAQCAAQEEQLVELRTAMSELQVCVEGARKSAVQQEAELEDLRSQAASRAVAADNGTAAVSAMDTPVKGDQGADGEGVDTLLGGVDTLLGAVGAEGCGAVAGDSGKDAQALHARLEEALQLVQSEKRQVEEASVRCDAQQQELATLKEGLATAQQSAEMQQAELGSIKEELTSAKESSESLEDEKAMLEEALEGAQRQLQSLQQQVTEASEKLADAEKTVAQFHQEKAAAEEQLQTATAGSEASQIEIQLAVEEAEKKAESAVEAQKTEHINALEEQRLQHVADIEDLKAESTEKLKSGTAELKSALKNVQAQLKAVGADKAATTAHATQELDALRKELQARKQQLESTQVSLAEHQTSHEEQVQALQVRIDGMGVAAKKDVSKLQSEVESLNKRLEHLQKVNREKRQEIEDLHIKHGTVQSGASVAEAKVDKFTRDLADAHKRIEELTNKLSQQDASIRELGDVKSMLAKTPGISKELAVAAQLEGMLSMAQSAAKLLEEMKVLRESASEGKQLRSEMLTLSCRAAEDAAASKRLQQELAQAISDLTASQDQLQVYRAELQRVQKQAKKDRVRYDTEMSRSDSLLDSLPSNDVAQWPEPVQALVASQVAAAVEDARSLLQAEAETAVDDLEEQLTSLQQQLAESKSLAAAMSERLNVAQEQSQHLETELKGQEVAMQTQISELKAQLQRVSAGESVEEGLDAERRTWQGKCAELSVQVAELRQKLQASRSQAMLALKEKQDEMLPPSRHASGAGSQGVTSPPELSSDLAYAPAGSGQQASTENDIDGLFAQQPFSTNPVQEGVTDYWKRRCNGLQKEVSLLQNDLADQMHVHELRDLADGCRKEEIQELQAVKSRSTVDVEYLKNIMIGFFEAGQLPHNEQVLVVLDRLLSFTARDKSRIWKQRQNDKGIVASFFGK